MRIPWTWTTAATAQPNSQPTNRLTVYFLPSTSTVCASTILPLPSINSTSDYDRELGTETERQWNWKRMGQVQQAPPLPAPMEAAATASALTRVLEGVFVGAVEPVELLPLGIQELGPGVGGEGLLLPPALSVGRL
jgi:hypothetical protein